MLTVKIYYYKSEHYPDIFITSADDVKVLKPDSPYTKANMVLQPNGPVIQASEILYPIEGRNIAFIMNEAGATIETVKGPDFV